MTHILLHLGLPSLDTMLINAPYSFQCQLLMCNNRLIKHLLVFGVSFLLFYRYTHRFSVFRCASSLL